jgi:integrase
MPSSKPRRERPTRTPGVYRDSLSGDYIVRIRAGGRNLKRRGVRSYAEAVELRSRLAAEPPVDSAGVPTFAEYFAVWRATYQGRTGRGVQPETLADYCASVERYALPVLGDIRLDQLDAHRLRRWVADLHARPLKRNSVRLALAPVRVMLAQAFEDGLVSRNAAAGIRVQASRADYSDAAADQRERGLSRDQLERLIAAVAEPSDALLVRFLAETGLRFSEANALRWSDVESDRVVVWRRYRRRRMDGPKSRKARRVPISPTLARDLWQHRKRARWNADSDPVWTTPTGERLDYSNVLRDVLKPAARRVGLDARGFGWHDLRHTCATLLVVEHELHPKRIQAWLGHSTPDLALRLYAHLGDDDLAPVDWSRVHSVSTPDEPTADDDAETG